MHIRCLRVPPRSLQEKNFFIESAVIIVKCAGIYFLALEIWRSTSEWFICKYCGKVFYNFRKQKKHLRNFHAEKCIWKILFNITNVNEALFSIFCRGCDNNFRTFVILKKHIKWAQKKVWGNPEVLWLISKINFCVADMFLINWRMFFFNCFLFFQLWKM